MSQITSSQFEKIVIPAGVAGQVTGKFAMPEGVLGSTLWVPALSANVNFTIQALTPMDGSSDTEVWTALTTVLTGGAAITQSTVSGLGTTAAIAYSFDAAVLGAGVYRLITTGAGTQAAAATAFITWRSTQERH